MIGGATIAATLIAATKRYGGTVTVTVGAITVDGIRDDQSAEMFTGEMANLGGDVRTVYVAAGSLGTLHSGAVITVDNEAHRIGSAQPYSDGAFTRIVLAP